MNDNLALDFIRVTEAGAIAAAKWIGRGDGKAADQAAVDAMRAAFNEMHFNGVVVIGEGAKDEAPELSIGEKIGTGEGPLYEIAIDPLECTDSVAHGRTNALSVIATGAEGSLYHAADAYMNKIAVGPQARDVIDITAPVKDNVQKVARALGKDVSELTVSVLDRERHLSLIQEIRVAGARVQLVSDGDVATAIAACLPESPIDMILGMGGSTEGVLAATAVRCLGGGMQVMWTPKDEKQIQRLNKAGISDFSKVLHAEELAKGDSISFTATGVLAGPLVGGVIFESNRTITHSFVTTLKPQSMRFIKTVHNE